MRKIKILVLSFCFLGCFQDRITPSELLDYTERMVLNGTIDTDKAIGIEITNSSSATDPLLPRLVKNADVVMVRNKDEISLTFNEFTETYTTSETVASGDAITLRVNHPNYPNANASFKMPQEISASGSFIKEGGVDADGDPGDLITVTFTDDANRNNYYQLNFYYFNETISQFIPMAFETSDPSLLDYNSYKLNDGSVLFSDELFNGKEKALSTVAPFGIVAFNTGNKYLIEISSISEDLFKYHKSLQRAEDAKEITFQAGYNNAVVIHSNVTSGLGILGASSSNSIILK